MRGFTLIETVIYLALLSIIMIGVFSSVFMVIDSNQKKNTIDEDSAMLNILLTVYE